MSTERPEERLRDALGALSGCGDIRFSAEIDEHHASALAALGELEARAEKAEAQAASWRTHDERRVRAAEARVGVLEAQRDTLAEALEEACDWLDPDLAERPLNKPIHDADRRLVAQWREVLAAVGEEETPA